MCVVGFVLVLWCDFVEGGYVVEWVVWCDDGVVGIGCDDGLV